MTARDETRARVMTLAAQALEEAMDEKWEASGAAIQAIAGDAGVGGLLIAVTAWCDTLFVSQRRACGMPDEIGPGEIVRPLWVNDETGGTSTDARVVDQSAQWAGQLLAARASMDHATYRALLAAVPPEETGAYLGGLLESVALGMNALLGGAL